MCDAPITYNEYERICSVVLSTLENLQTNLSMDCMYIALVSQEILHYHHGINASIVSGQAKIFLGIDSKGVGQILSFGKVDNAPRDQSAFHAWIRIDNWLLDFSAPIYREALDEIRQGMSSGIRVPRKMMAIKMDEFGKFAAHNQLTKFIEDDNDRSEMMSSYRGNMQFKYSLDECLDWYQKDSNECCAEHICKKEFGKSAKLRLMDLRLEGSW